MRPSLVESIVANYRKAVVGAKESEEYFEDLLGAVSEEMSGKWLKQMLDANQERENGNYAAMDIYDVQVASRMYSVLLVIISMRSHCRLAPTRAQKQLGLTEDEEKGPSHLRGVAAWLAGGIEIEEAQYVDLVPFITPLSLAV